MIIKLAVICNTPSTQGFSQKTLIKFSAEYILHSMALCRKVKGHYIPLLIYSYYISEAKSPQRAHQQLRQVSKQELAV